MLLANRLFAAAGLVVLIGSGIAVAQPSGISGHAPPPAAKAPPAKEPYKSAMPTVDEKVMPPQSSYDSPPPAGRSGVSKGSPGSSDASHSAPGR
jgi:hypothetical protein